MTGYMAFGTPDCWRGYARGRAAETSLAVCATITVPGVDGFILDPAHEARITGEVMCDALGGRLPVEQGVFNLFVDDGDPAHKRMTYLLFIRDAAGHPLTLSGFKDVADGRGRGAWRDTTTLFTRLLQGHVAARDEDGAEVVAAGVIRITAPAFLRQLTTFRTSGPTAADRAAALARFGAFFLGSLWDVYARKVLTYAPF